MNVIHMANADPALANADSNDEGAACAMRADRVIPMGLNGFGINANAMAQVWEDPFDVHIDGGDHERRTASRVDMCETRQLLDVGAAKRQEEPEQQVW